MAFTSQTILFDEILGFLASTPSSQAIIEFHTSNALQARASDLLDKNREGQLYVGEPHELDEFQRMNHFMSMLKARAYQKMEANE